MNAKQRVLNAIDHREVDRLPRSLSANRFVRENLMRKSGCTQYEWPRADWFNFNDFREKLEPYSEFGVMASGASVFQHPTFLRGMDTFLLDLAHQYDIRFMLHSCGDVSRLIPSFIKLGIDILDPIQVSASNMDLYSLHEKYGEQICLHGGVDTQRFLPNTTPRGVMEEYKRIENYFENKTGYILSTSHVIEGDVPLENIDALYRGELPVKSE